MKQFACIDIGGTAIKYGRIDEQGTLRARHEIPTEAHKGGAHLLARALELVEAMAAEAEIAGVAISTAGMVDPEQGAIIFAGPAIPQYAGTQFKQVLEARLGLPVEVENDVNCAGLAECLDGAAKGFDHALVLTIGTGIGGCFIEKGEVLHGAGNAACEVGYLPMDGSKFELLGSTSALTRQVAAAKGEPEENWSGRAIFAAAKEGDPICLQGIDEMCEILGRGLATISFILNPDVVVLGGGIMAQEAMLRPKIEAAMHQYLVPAVEDCLQLEFAAHQNDAGMKGAFAHFKNRHPELF